MDYGYILKRAGEIVWRHKFLWALGFLVALGSGGGGGGGNNFNFNFGSNGELDEAALQQFEQAAAHFQEFLAAYTALFIGLACIATVLGFIFWLARLVAEAGLVDAVNKIEDGETSNFGAAMSAGAAALLRVIGLRIILALPFILILGVMALLGFGVFGGAIAAAVNESSAGLGAALGALGLMLACLIPLICILFILGLIVYGIDLFAVRGIVTRNMGVIEGLQHGWQTLRNNLLEAVVTALVLWVIGLLFGFVVAAVVFPFGLLFAAPTFFSLLADGNISFSALATTGVGFGCLGIVAAVVNSIWLAYQSTTFTLAYRHFTGGKAKFIND
jgi:hypothetical protein